MAEEEGESTHDRAGEGRGEADDTSGTPEVPLAF
jgi:hypothetical protein